MGPQIYQGLDYRICVRQEKGFCSMTVSESLPGSVAPDSFLLAEMTKTVLELQTAATAMAFTGTACDISYVMVGDTQVCGSFFSTTAGVAEGVAGPVTDAVAPFAIDVFTSSFDLDAATTGQVFDPTGTAFIQYHRFPNSRLINSNFRTKNSHYLYPQKKFKKISKGTIYMFHKKSPHSNSYLTLKELFLFLKLQ